MHLAGHFAVGFGLFHGFAFVVLLSALADSQKHFGSTSLEVHLQRDQSQALLLRLSGEPLNLATVEEQFPRAARLVVRTTMPSATAVTHAGCKVRAPSMSTRQTRHEPGLATPSR